MALQTRRFWGERRCRCDALPAAPIPPPGSGCPDAHFWNSRRCRLRESHIEELTPLTPFLSKQSCHGKDVPSSFKRCCSIRCRTTNTAEPSRGRPIRRTVGSQPRVHFIRGGGEFGVQMLGLKFVVTRDRSPDAGLMARLYNVVTHHSRCRGSIVEQETIKERDPHQALKTFSLCSHRGWPRCGLQNCNR